jgi:chemotaxis protein methyltransferase CheR
MRIADFDLYKDLLKQKSGLTLTPDKTYLLDSRLTPIAKKWDLASIDELTDSLRGVPEPDMVNDVVEAMTTNETSFFRDNRPFDTFKELILPYLLEKRTTQRNFRVWSAASSSGQEAYSLAMLLKESSTPLAGWNIEILGTDISNEIVAQAERGEYTQFEVQRGLPIQLLMKYFEQTGDKWQLNKEIRDLVKFKYFNLLDTMSMLGTFDVVFCRNVLIYFDDETKADVLRRIEAQLAPDGFLLLGGAETVLGITDAFKPLEGYRGLYVKANSTFNADKDSASASEGSSALFKTS